MGASTLYMLPFDANCTDILLHSVIPCMQHLLDLQYMHSIQKMHDNVMVHKVTFAVGDELDLRRCLH